MRIRCTAKERDDRQVLASRAVPPASPPANGITTVRSSTAPRSATAVNRRLGAVNPSCAKTARQRARRERKDECPRSRRPAGRRRRDCSCVRKPLRGRRSIAKSRDLFLRAGGRPAGLAAAQAAGVAYPEPARRGLQNSNFRFAHGETLPELSIHYRTIGTPRRDAAGVVRNAVLLLHGTTGSGKQFLTPNFGGVLFGRGTAPRREPLLPGDPGRDRPRRIVPTQSGPPRAISALRLRRHGRGAVPAPDSRARCEPPAARPRHVDGWNARLGLGGDSPRVHGRPRPARLGPDADRRPQSDPAEDDHRRHPDRPGVEERRIRDAAARPRRRHADPPRHDVEPSPMARRGPDAGDGGPALSPTR